MNVFDIIFLDIYRSIRGDWSSSVDERGEYLIKILPQTTLLKPIQKRLKFKFKEMIVAYNDNKEWFDGRDWARGGVHNYDELQLMEDWFDKKFYDIWSIYDNCGMFVM